MNKGKKKYDNEKVIFDKREACLSLSSPNRGFLLFFMSGLKNLYGSQRKLKVLDVGCGVGAKTRALKKFFPNFDFQGCDISRNAIRMAKRNSNGVKFFVGDALKLPVKSSQFDVVIMNSVLDHTLNPSKAVSEIYRVLKKGGTYLVTGPLEAEPSTLHGQLTRFKRFRNLRKQRCGHNFAFNRKSFLELVKRPGFKIESLTLDWFYFSQLVDIFYYPFLQFMGKDPEFTLEQFSFKDNSFNSRAVRYLRTFFTILENIESTLTLSIPLGFFAYVKAKKIR